MAKDFSAVFGKKTAQEEEDRRQAEEEKKKAREAERARLAEEKRRAAEEAARKNERENPEYLNIKEAREKKYALEQELSKARAGAKEQSRNAGTAAIVASGRGGGKAVVDLETQRRISGIEKEIVNLERDINLAAKAQNKKYQYNSALKAEDFGKYSFEPEKETERETIKPHRQNIGRETETVKGYMTEDERAVYNYYLNKFGEKRAEEFFDSIREELNQRQAEAIFKGNEGKIINEYIQGAAAGLENAKEGFKGAARMLLGDDKAQPAGTFEYVGKMAREDLGERGIKLPEQLGGASLGQIGYDLINTTANMLPSLVLGTLGGGAVGAAAIGSSAAGNAYNKAIGEGYDKEQAASYAALVGASEASLGYLLGGIEATGGKLGKAAMTKLLGKIDNALLKTAVSVGGRMGSEFTEEYLQSILEPVFGNIVLLEENEIDLLSSEAVYSGIMGALSAGGIAAFGGSGNNTKVPVPFEGKAQPGTEQGMVADKIAEIENRPISDAEKAAAMEKVAAAVLETTGNPEVIAEAEKFRNIHEERAAAEMQRNPGETASETQQEGLFGPEIIGKILGLEPVETEADAGFERERLLNKENRNNIQYNDIDYGDAETKTAITQNVHNDMLRKGKIVVVDENTLGKVAESYPDIRNVKKKDRIPVLKEKMKSLKNDLRRFLSGIKGTYDFEIEGNIIEATLYDTGINEVLEKITQNKANMLYVSKDIFQNAQYLYSTQDYDGSPNISRWNYFYTPVQIGEDLVGVRIAVRDMKKANESQIYNWGIKKDATLGDVSGGNIPSQYPASSVASNNIISPASDKFNPPSIGNSVFGPEIIKEILGFGEETKSGKPIEHGEYESVSAEAEESARNVLGLLSQRPKPQSSTGQVKTEAFGSNEPEVSVPQAEKSRRFERRYQRTVEDGVASVFGVSRSDLRGDVRPIIEEITADLKDGKNISDSRLDALYKAAFDDGIITEEFPQYQDTRKYIRTTPIFVDEKTRHEFGDDYAFRDFARSNFDSIKISSDPRSRYLDEFYGELSGIAPEFFNEFETDPKTQLEDIADFMQQTKKQYYGLSEVYGGENLAEFESWAKKELRNYLDDFKKGIDVVSRYERDRQIKATNKARSMNTEASFDEAKAAFADNKVFDAKRTLEKAHEKNLLDETDKVAVKRLLEGTMTEADVRLQSAGNVEGILEVYEAEKAYKAARAPFDRYKAAYKNALLHEAIEVTENSDEWKDKKIGAFYSRETAERNILDITKNGRLGGKKVVEEYFKPVHENEAMKNRWISELNSRVRALELGRMNEWERAYAQMIGENAAYISEGKITKHNEAEHAMLNEKIDNILHEHGNRIDRTKCEKAAAGLLEIYKDIHEQWNDERIRRGQEPVGYVENYFPHFTEAKPETVLQKIFAVLGFDIGSSKLPTDIAGRTADRKPNTKYNPFANRRTSDTTDYDIFKGFDSYIRAVGDNIFHTEDIQKLRALSDTIRTKYSSVELEKRIEEIRTDDRYSEADKEALISDAIKNAGNMYHLSNFVVWLDEYTNILAGKKNRGDREAEYQMGREVYDISKALEGRIAANMIGYNASTPIMNLVPLFQATADLSPADIISSLAQTGVAAIKGDSYISDNSDFIINRLGVDSVYRQNYSLFTAENMKDAVAKIQDGGAFAMELMDRIVSDTLVRARVTQNMRDKGMSTEEAFSEADQWAAGLIADRSLGALPTVFNVKNPIAKAFTMFQVEANNQYSYIAKDAGSYKWSKEGAFDTIAGQLVFWAAMALCNALGDELLGRDNIVPDPIGMTAETIEKLQKGEPIGDVMLDTATTIVEQMPFIGGIMGGGRIPLSTALPDMEQVVKLFNEEVSDEKKGQIILESLAKPLSYILAPSGAGQIWKTVQGAQQIAAGGAYGTEADGTEYLKFLQGKELDDFYKTLLFGRYASDAGQEYIDSGFSTSLSAKQTEQMKMAEKFGVTNEEFYSAMMALRGYSTDAAKQEALFALDISENAKNVIDGIIWGGMTYKDETPQNTRDYSSDEAFYISGIMAKDFRLHELGYSENEIADINKALKKSGTKAGQLENLGKVLGTSEAETFEVYQRMNGDWIENAEDLSEEEAARASGAEDFYGMSTEDYITVLNYSMLGTLVDGEYKTSAKYVIPKIAEILNIDTETATDMYRKVHSFDYSRADLEESQIEALDISQNRYGVDDYGYFVAKNAAFIAEGEKDEWGNTVEGSAKAEAIANIAKQLGIDENEATIYYLAAEGELILSVEELTSSHRDDLVEAKKYGWTEMQYINAVNVLMVAGASKKDEIIKALMDAGASYAMAQGYYNLRQDKDYNRYVGKTTVAYGMSTQKQADKVDYFVGNYNSDGNVSTSDVAKWVKATKGIRKKTEYISACMDAGATYQQAVTLYALMMGHDDNFNAWYKENGG